MFYRALFLLSFLLIFISISAQNPYALAIHGGAGVMSRDRMSAERQREYTYHLDKALNIGDSILRNGGNAADAVVEVVSYLEDCPLFNAGKGAVFTQDRKSVV